MTNVVVVYSDDGPRPDAVRFMPFLTGLRREATDYPNCRLNVPVCQAARAGFLTGQYALNNSVYDNNTWGLTNTDLLPAWLTTAGVETGFFGKYPIATPDTDHWDTIRHFTLATEQDKYAFDVSDGTSTTSPDGNQIDYLATQVDTFITGATEPFFAWVCPSHPHVQTSGDQKCQPSPDTLTGLSWLRWDYQLEADVSDKPTRISSLSAPSDAALADGRGKIRNQIRECRDLDGLISSIYTSLADAGVLDDTLLIVTTDGGVFYGEHRLGYTGDVLDIKTKDEPYDVVSRVPLLVRGPGYGTGTRDDNPYTGQDITATIVDTFDATPTVTLDGIVLGTATASREVLYEKNTPSGDQADGIVTKTRKLIRWVGETGTDEFEMYDLDSDPHEHTNVANDAGRRAERDDLESALDTLLGG